MLLSYLLPSLPALNPEAGKATSVSVATLSNGLTVVSEDACTASTVTLTYPKAGSANEAYDEQGAAYANKFLNFKSGSRLSTLRINRTIEVDGGRPVATVDRHAATVGYTVVPEKAVGLIPLLATDCSFERWDVRDARAVAKVETGVVVTSAQIVLTETLYAAAYGPQSPAGRPLYSTAFEPSLDKIMKFRSRAYGLNGAVLAATGIKDHSAFCSEVESLLSESPAGTLDGPAPITYLGGESRVASPSGGHAHVALAFQSPSSSAVASVAKHVFEILGAESGVSAFTSKGLVGVYGGSHSPGALVDDLTKTVTATVSPDVLKRAKGMAKADALLALDGGSKSLAATMTAAVLDGATFSNPSDIAAIYDAVTDAQVKDAITAMLKSNPALAAVGDISLVPYHATLAARLS